LFFLENLKHIFTWCYFLWFYSFCVICSTEI